MYSADQRLILGIEPVRAPLAPWEDAQERARTIHLSPSKADIGRSAARED